MDEELLALQAQLEQIKAMPVPTGNNSIIEDPELSQLQAELQRVRNIPVPDASGMTWTPEQQAQFEASQGKPADWGNALQSPLEKNDADKKRRLSQLVAGLSGAAEGSLMGYGDEAISGGAAGLDYLTSLGGQDFGSQYDKYMSLQNQAAKESPVVNTSADILASVLNPANKLSQGKNALSTILRAGGMGAVEGFGRNEDNRTGGAIGGALVSGGTSGAVEALKGLGRMGLNAQLRAVGATKTDLKKASESVGRGKENPLIASFQRLKGKGEFGLRKGTLDPLELERTFPQKVSTLSNKLEGVLEEADKVSGGVTPSFQKTRELLDEFNVKESFDTIKSTARGNVRHLTIPKAGTSKAQLDGTLKSMQEAKKAYGEMGFGSVFDTAETSAKKSVYRAISSDLKNTIESQVNNLVKRGKLKPELKDSVVKLNTEMADYLKFKDIIKDRAAAARSEDVVTKGLGMLRTSGGIGVPLIAGYLSGGDASTAAGTALLYQALLNPRGRYMTGQVFEGLGKVADKTPAYELSRALQAIYNK